MNRKAVWMEAQMQDWDEHFLESRNLRKDTEVINGRKCVTCVESLAISVGIVLRITFKNLQNLNTKPSLLVQSIMRNLVRTLMNIKRKLMRYHLICNSKAWIIDSGASSHMTHSRELLVNYEEFAKPQKVCLGDGHTREAMEEGA